MSKVELSHEFFEQMAKIVPLPAWAIKSAIKRDELECEIYCLLGYDELSLEIVDYAALVYNTDILEQVRNKAAMGIPACDILKWLKTGGDE